MAAIVFLVIVVVIVFWAISIYNGLVAMRNRFKNAFAQIDVQAKREGGAVAAKLDCMRNGCAANHQTGAGDEPALVGSDYAVVDTSAEAEVVGVHNEVFVSVHRDRVLATGRVERGVPRLGGPGGGAQRVH